MSDYQELINAKIVTAPSTGFAADPTALHPSLFPHQRDIVLWNLAGGCRAVFASFGLGKTRIAIETARQVIQHEGPAALALFIAPLGVRQEFTRKDGPAMGVDIRYCRNMQEVHEATQHTSYIITNYERIRSGDIDPNHFTIVSLDEASTLRSTGSDTFEVFMTTFTAVKYRYVYTATPAPNRFIELINYAHFLGIMDRGQALTRFFKRDSQKAGNLTIHPHKEREFWLWTCSWAIMIYRPSDLGYSDEGYDLPELQVHWHEIPADHSQAWDKTDDSGQRYLLQHDAMGLVAGAAEKRASITQRLQRAQEVVSEFGPDSNWLMWHHLEGERAAIERAFPDSLSVYGSLDLDTREQRIIDFSEGQIRILNTKPELSGSGCNFQRHCHQNLFLGISYDFNDFIQAIHRTHRFQQPHPVQVHIIHTETERSIVAELKRKWAQHNALQANMRAIVSEHGLHQLKTVAALSRSATVQRREETGPSWVYINNDCVLESSQLDTDTIGLVVTSIPFSNHYEYTPSYLDFGHTDNDNHFFAQLDHLIPQLLRILQPGRIACVHVKDRIFYGSTTGTGFSTVNPFHAKTTFAFMQHGFEYMGMAVIPTDVVAENNQTYRLTYGEMGKDGTKMGFGSPEFLLCFRKPQTNKGKSYADMPVTKNIIGYDAEERPIYATSLGWWQIVADATWRSSGDRLLDIPSLIRLARTEKGLGDVREAYRRHCQEFGYDFDQHVALAEALAEKGRLPKKFALMQPPLTDAQRDLIWDDINRMNTLNMSQALQKKEQHVCPLQIDVVRRCIERFSNAGDVVFDPFAGISTVPLTAVRMGRYGLGTELNPDYFRDGVFYLRQQDAKMNVPTLFDSLEKVA
jgi:DNA modification methylase